LGEFALRVELVFRHNLKREDTFSVWVDPSKNNIGKKWVRALRRTLIENSHLEKRVNFYGWIGDRRNLVKLCEEMNRSINQINRFGRDGKWSGGYRIDIQCSPENVCQDLINSIHHHFEILMGQVWSMSEYYANADAETRYAIRQINILCHQLEARQRSMAIHQKNPKLLNPQLFVSFMDEHFNRYDLAPDDYEHFTCRRGFGDVFMFYCQSGKTHIEAWGDKDEEIFGNNINGLRYFSSEFIIQFGEGSEQKIHEMRMLAFSEWLRSKGADVNGVPPYFVDANGRVQGLGWLKIGQMPMAQFGGLSPLEVQAKILEHMDLSSIRIHGLGTEVISGKYEYSWSDSDYDSREIAILKNPPPVKFPELRSDVFIE
jgi:hypothetical protein